MKGKPLVTAVAVLATAVAVPAVAQNVDTKSCAWGSNLLVQVADITVKQGEAVRPMYSYQVSVPFGGYYDIPFVLQIDWCINGTCQHADWQRTAGYPTGAHEGFTAAFPFQQVMPNAGTYNATFRMHSKELACDVTAVGTIFVQ